MYIYKDTAYLMQRRHAGQDETEGSDSLLSHWIRVGPLHLSLLFISDIPMLGVWDSKGYHRI